MLHSGQAKIVQLDRNFESFLDRVLFETVETELTPEKRSQRRARADTDDLEFAKIYFPKIFDAPWSAMHYHIAGLKSGKHTLSGFPMLGKTALTCVAKAIKPICLGLGGIINMSLRTKDIAQERTAALSRLLQRNRMLCYDYDVAVQQDLKGYHIINHTTLVATSVEIGLRHYIDEDFKRFMISINDDLYNRQSVNSQNDNDKVTNFVTGEVYRQMEDDGLSITLGNSINTDCPIVRLKELFPGNHFSQPALDEHGRSTWPERYDDAYWKAKQAETPLDVWSGEYMDTPYIRGEIFNENMIHHVNVNLLKIVATITACDPAYGQSPESCLKALATISVTDKRETVMEDIWLRRESYLNMFDYVERLRIRFPRWKALLFEDDFSQWLLAKPYYMQWIQSHRPLTIIPHHSKNNATELYGADKESRIMNLVHPHQMRMFLYSELLKSSRDFEMYLRQLYGFGKSKEKLDGPDAASTAWILIFNYLNEGSFQSSRKRKFKLDRIFKGRMFH